MATESASEKRLIVCRQQSCGQKIAVPDGGEGHVRCPRCNRRFWTTTRGGPFVRALRISLHNQEGIGQTAAGLLGLAVLWIGGLWSVRDELPHATAIMLGAAAVSYGILAWLQRRMGEPNALSGAVKEAKHFFLILGLAAALFLGLTLWRSSQMDAVSASTTLRELEMLRDQFRSSHLVGFLKSTPWKVALLGLLTLALVIPFVHVRKALRETNRLAGTGVRRLFYIVTALSTFTFAGELHDAVLTRSEAALKRDIDDITKGYEAYAAVVTPALLDVLADELTAIDEEDDDDDELPIRTQVEPINPPPPTDASASAGVRPDKGPRPSAPNPSAPRDAEYRKSVLNDLAAEFKTDASRIARNIEDVTQEQPARPRTPENLTQQTVRNASAPAEAPAARQSSRPEIKEVRSIVRGSLGLAMSGRVDPASTLLEGLRANHPLQAELKDLTKMLVDGPIQEAVREIVSQAIVESMSDLKKSMKDCIKGAIARAKQTTASRIEQLKSSSRNVAGRVVEISRGIAGNTKVAGMETLYRQASADFPELWKEASSRLPGSAKQAANAAFEAMQERAEGWNDARRAATYTKKAIELRNMSLASGNERRIANVLIETERNVLSTTTIESAYRSEVRERERLAAAERVRRAEEQAQERADARKRQAERERIAQEDLRKRVREILRVPGTQEGGSSGGSSDELVACTCTRTGATTIRRASECHGPC